MKIIRALCLAASMAAAAACDSDGVVRPPPTEVYIYNGASNVERIDFYREQLAEDAMAYGDGTRKVFDSGPYDFHLEYLQPGASQLTRTAEFDATLSPDLDYIFVALAPNGVPEVLTFTADDRPDDGVSTARWTIAHAFEGAGELDVYFEPPGTMLASATPRGSVSFGQDPLTFDTAPDTYRLYLTTAGDPNEVHLETLNLTLAAGDDEVTVISDPGAQGTYGFVVSRILPNENTARIPEAGLQSRLRAVNGIDDRMDRDIHVNDTTTPPIFAALPFGVLSDYVDVGIGPRVVITTPVGNPGGAEFSSIYTAVSGIQFTVLVTGNSTDGISHHIVSEDKRSISGQATLRIYNAAGLFDRVAVYVTEPGTDITQTFPNVEIPPPNSTPRNGFLPGDYEITVQDAETEAILAGPEPVTLEAGGVYGILLLNAADASTIDIQYFEDFAP